MLRFWTSVLGFCVLGVLPACTDGTSSSVVPEEAPESVSTQSEAAGSTPDVVVIMIDTLRPDHLPIHGYDQDTAPFVSAWAAESAVFETAWSTSSWTAPSTASVFTGLYPHQHGVVLGMFAPDHDVAAMRAGEQSTIAGTALPAELRTLPEMFQDAGYRTFGAAANINLGPVLGFQRGFDRFHYSHQAHARELAETLVGWQSEIEAGPAFIYLHLNDVHSPYLQREPWYVPQTDELADMQSAYDSEIAYTDQYIGRLVERFGWEDDWVMIITDHGEEFEDHGQRGHLTTLYRELVQVLWMVHGPQIDPQRIEGAVSLVDVLPTLLELSGLTIPSNVQGLSMAPQLTGTQDMQPLLRDRAVFHQRVERQTDDPRGWRELWGVTVQEHRLIEEAGRYELYDSMTDPKERQNLADASPDVVQNLAAQLTAFRNQKSAVWSSEVEIPLEPDLYEQLKVIGYVQ